MNAVGLKVAIITGISKGIGRALALKLLESEVAVAGWGLHVPDYVHPNLLFVKCDITDERQVENAARFTLEKLGPADYLINNAGSGYFHSIENFPSSAWKAMFDLNVNGAFFVTRAVVSQMKSRQSGHIVNISSIAGKVGAPQGEGYNATKFALRGFSESLFVELRSHGIKVTTVYPGSVQTGFFDDIPAVTAHSNMLQPQDLADTLVHILESPPNYCISEIEIRPLNSKPPAKD